MVLALGFGQGGGGGSTARVLKASCIRILVSRLSLSNVM